MGQLNIAVFNEVLPEGVKHQGCFVLLYGKAGLAFIDIRVPAGAYGPVRIVFVM
ncbi:hypothetical protein D3C73_1538100 [compost metagenome]